VGRQGNDEEKHMRKLIATGAVALMVLGGGNVALANNGNGGPPFHGGGINEGHPAWYGLCIAYYNNSPEGKKNGAPFEALDKHDWSQSTYENVDDFCKSLRPSNGRGQGNQDDSAADNPGPRGNK
jgi:hypothetical protein